MVAAAWSTGSTTPPWPRSRARATASASVAPVSRPPL